MTPATRAALHLPGADDDQRRTGPTDADPHRTDRNELHSHSAAGLPAQSWALRREYLR
jgi:hypothetical protein